MGSTITYSAIGECGRLGNQMFQIATVIGTAKKHNADWLIPVPIPHYKDDKIVGYNHNAFFGEGLNFRVVNADWIKNYPNKMVYSETVINFTEIDLSEGIAQFPHVIYDLKGFFQSWKYFANAEEEVRNIFSLKAYQPEVYSFKREIGLTVLNQKWIAVGIRLTDYLEKKDFYYNLIEETDYYQKAFDYFSNKYACKFVIFSDDILKAKVLINNLNTKHDFLFIDYRHSVDGLPLYASCDGFIVPNSTFHWWGAWLGNPDKNKDVTMPINWFKYPSYKAGDLYTENAILL